jgi:hypothetical protein
MFRRAPKGVHPLRHRVVHNTSPQDTISWPRLAPPATGNLTRKGPRYPNQYIWTPEDTHLKW